ncbi:MAG: hypothetical protein E7338_04265 [Clostridiales bacterium]|nr:hypothetical protein [Clostridiales bacterium]
MENTKKQKVIRIVGLVTLTILVIVGVILTVYFVQKADNSKVIGQIGQTIEQDNYNYTVTNFKINKETATDEYVEVTTYITMEAKKNISVKIKDFSLNNYELKDAVSFPEKINKGEKASFELNWVVKKDSELLYLIYKNIRIALGEVQL